MSADTLARVLVRSGLGAVLSRVPVWRGVLVLDYHRIGSFDGGVYDPGLWSATQDQLDEQLRYLARNAEVVGGDVLPEALAERRGRLVALTFDDGYRDNYDLAYPVLRAHGLPATFFLTTSFLDRPHVAWWDEISWMVRSSARESIDADGWLSDRVSLRGEQRCVAARKLVERYWSLPATHAGPYLDWLAGACGTGRADPAAADATWMTWEMAREMRDGGMTFGAHTVHHPLLARCSADVQAVEVGTSVSRLREQLGEPVNLFAYPVGSRSSFDDTTRACLHEAGITHAFSLYGGHQGVGGIDELDIPRVAIGPTVSPARFRAICTLPRAFASPAADPILAVHPGPVLAPPPLEGAAPSSSGWGGAVRRGVVWSAAAFASSKALSFVSIIVLAHLLVPRQFGVVAAVAAFIALTELGSDLGMKPTVVYEQEVGISDRIQTAFTLNLTAALILTGLCVLAAPAMAGFFGAEDQANLFRLGAFNLLFTGLGNIQDGLLLRDMSFRRRIRPQIVRDLARLAVSLVLAFAGFGALALVLGFLAGTLAWTVMQWTITPFRPKFTFDATIARSMLGYGAPAALLAFLSTIAVRTDVFAIGHLIDSHALGIYTIAYRLPEVLLASVAYTLGVVAFPALARRRIEDPDGLKSATLELVRYQALYALPVAAGLAVLSVPIVQVLFGREWSEAAGVLVPVVLAAAIVTITYPLGDLLKAVGKQGLLAGLNVVQIPAVIAACLIAAPSGLLAVAWAMVAANVLFVGLLSWAVMRELGFGLGRLGGLTAPALVAAAGVLVGSGAVRVLWPQPSVPGLFVATVAGGVGAVAALRILAPQTYRDAAQQISGLRAPRS